MIPVVVASEMGRAQTGLFTDRGYRTTDVNKYQTELPGKVSNIG
jgi:hypothetical protein